MAPNISYLQPSLNSQQLQSTAHITFVAFDSLQNSDYFELQPEGHYVYQLPNQPKQSYIDGECWPPVFKPNNVRSIKNMIPRDDDVFVCTYPKCGTTWIQHICAQLMSETYGPASGNGMLPELSVTSPMIDRMGADYAENLPSPRLLKSHFVWHNMPKNPKAKYIYCVRNPKDCLTSYFFHNQNFKIYNFEFGKFDDFFNLFMTDKIAFGNYYQHLLSWLPHVNDENVLFLRYEDMCADLRTAVKKIGNFLGGEAAKKVNDENELEKIVEESKIDSMKKDQSRWFPADNLRGKPFIRKGGSRDWKNYFSRKQSDQFDLQWRMNVIGTIAENWWKAEMAWDDVDSEDDGIEADYCDIKATNKSEPLNIVGSYRKHGKSESEESAYGSIDDNFLKRLSLDEGVPVTKNSNF